MGKIASSDRWSTWFAIFLVYDFKLEQLQFWEKN